MKLIGQLLKQILMGGVILSIVGAHALFAQELNHPPPEEIIKEVFETFNSWGGRGVSPGVAHIGVMAACRVTGDPDYCLHTLEWANRNNENVLPWTLGELSPTEREDKEADPMAAGQVFIELYEWCQRNPKYDELCNNEDAAPTDDDKLASIRNAVEHVMNGDERYDWWWIDSLFMAAPVLSQFGDAKLDVADPDVSYTEEDYFATLKERYLKTRNGGYNRDEPDQPLYDSEAGFWFRDDSYLFQERPPEKCKDYQEPDLAPISDKIFWSRGNGWVIGALTRLMMHMPEGHPDKTGLYTDDFKKMAAKLKERQRDDGFWSVSLHGPGDCPGPESSGTALFTYALAWGIREGMLPEHDYLEVVKRAWNGMVRHAVQEGQLGYVQPPATGPSPAGPNSRHRYGVGAFLLAGSEIVRLFDFKSIIQAEEAYRIAGDARVEANHPGYHGGGFVNFPPDGGVLEWRQVDGGPGGLATLSFRHALRRDDRTARLDINGASQDISFKSTGAWDAWEQLQVEVLLDPGAANLVRIQTTGQDSANIDGLAIAYQAEDTRVQIGGGSRVEFNHDGYHGSGFVNFPPNQGFIEWTDIDGGEDGRITLSFRYALGRSRRTAHLIVNGVPQNITFESTESWTTWEQKEVDEILNPGRNNTIRIETTGQDSANIDELLILANTS